MSDTALARDQEETAFSIILSDLVKRVPGAFAASLVDGDGECVDYVIAPSTRRAFEVSPFDVKVAAAHWAIARSEIAQRRAAIGALDRIICRGEKRSFILHTLPDDYALVVLLKKRAGFVAVSRAVDACVRALAAEAAWTLAKGRGIWTAVDVETDQRARPTWLRVGALSSAVEVLGALTKLNHRERGFRVRLPSGSELNLVREVGNRWYADEKLV